MTATTAGWISIVSPDLMLSMLVPAGWSAEAPAEDRLVLLRGDADEDGYRASLTFLRGVPEEESLDWFAQFCDQVPSTLAESMTDFHLMDTRTFRLSSRARVLTVTYQQHADGAPATSHLQAFVLSSDFDMFVLSGATLRAHEERDLETLERIVESLRVLPYRS